MKEVLRILILFHHYQDEEEDGIEVATDPTKDVEAIKSLTDSTFLTVAVISNAIEIVAHNSEAAIAVVKGYGDKELIAMIDKYMDGYELTKLPIGSDGEINTDVLNEMLRYMKDKRSD